MTVNEVRSRYLAFFEKRGHAIIPSASIVPENDPTTLFTSSGMQPLVPYLMGQTHPKGVRLTNSQLSFRAEDIEEVGDNRHTTFFEMLGNWSLGDYFKQEQLPWFYEFLTSKEEGLGLDPAKLYVTTFSGDEESGMAADTEAVEIWKKLGVPQERIFSYGAKKNWWSRAGVPSNMPAGEIGGPDSEVFYDFGSTSSPQVDEYHRVHGACHPNCDCGRFIEIGNSVFMQFIKQADGTFASLPKQNVDFGGGLERLTAATRENPDIFLIDVFNKARTTIEQHSSKAYEDRATNYAFRVVLDHVRAAVFLMRGGVLPSNKEQGYVVRKLLRRAVRFADMLGYAPGQLHLVGQAFIDTYKTAYTFEQEAGISSAILEEEKTFRETLGRGLRQLDRLVSGGSITAEDVFTLFTTYGFPIELTEEIAKERGLSVDREAVALLMKKHQEESRAGAAQKFAGGLADHSEQTVRYHTAHHLLLKSLQTVLGPDVHQRGSNITSERLRIDFSYGTKVTPEQLAEVEKLVNEKIAESLPVVRTIMKKEEAEKLGAEHEFGAKYPDMVSVYQIGDSIEFCGGPHVGNTSELGEGGKKFKILKEEASSAGVRRIKAVLA